MSLAGFLGSRITATINRPEGVMYFPVSTLKVDLPAFIDVYTVKRTIPSVRGSVTSPSPHRPIRKKRNFDRFSIGFAVRLILRVRLTPGRLTLPGKPWSIGERASHPLYRYLYLHLLFRKLHLRSSLGLQGRRNAPLPVLMYPMASVGSLIPDYYPRTAPRLVSCYALFE